MAWKSYTYETDPTKFVDPKAGAITRIGQTLGGLARAAAGAAGNAMLGDKSGRIWQDSDPAGTFAANNLRRYQSPTSVVPPAPVQAVARPTPQMKPAHTPGQRLIGTRPVAPTAPATTVSAPSPVARLTRKVAPPPVQAPTAAPQIPTETAPLDLGYIEQDGVRLYVPGSKSFESGVGVTESQPDAPAAAGRLRAGDLGYSGSQQEWEDQQAQVGMRTPIGLQLAAELRASRAQDETEANNLRTFGVNQQNADSTALSTMSQVGERTALLPGKLKEQASDLATAAVTRDETVEKTKGMRLVRDFYPEVTQADINYKNKLGEGVSNNAKTEAAKLAAELKYQAQMAAITARENDPIQKADADFYGTLATTTGLSPSQVAAAVEQGYTTPVKPVKDRWYRKGSPGALTNAEGVAYKPGAGKAVVATATDKAGQKWVKYADGTTAKVK